MECILKEEIFKLRKISNTILDPLVLKELKEVILELEKKQEFFENFNMEEILTKTIKEILNYVGYQDAVKDEKIVRYIKEELNIYNNYMPSYKNDIKGNIEKKVLRKIEDDLGVVITTEKLIKSMKKYQHALNNLYEPLAKDILERVENDFCKQDNIKYRGIGKEKFPSFVCYIKEILNQK